MVAGINRPIEECLGGAVGPRNPPDVVERDDAAIDTFEDGIHVGTYPFRERRLRSQLLVGRRELRHRLLGAQPLPAFGIGQRADQHADEPEDDILEQVIEAVAGHHAPRE